MHPIHERINKISPSFCAAKWLQVTLLLQNGHNHSCHHPKTHKISLKEIQQNPAALHNTRHKMQQRKQMLAGKRPKECSYCWKVEDLPGSHTSDRFFKSADFWAEPSLERISSEPWNQNIKPTYLEVSFSNICNFKCAYCYPDVSSKWMSEVLEFGPYPTSKPFGSLLYIKKVGTMPLVENTNPYRAAFWLWLPEIIQSLKVLRVTGGEPLLSKDCHQLLNFVELNPNPDLQLAINSNLGVSPLLVGQMVASLQQLVVKKRIKSAQIYTSIDSWGPQAEYLRFGLNLKLWKNNLESCLQLFPEIQTVIMVTFNALSVFSFTELLQFVLEKRKIYQTYPLIDISILHDPPHMNLFVLEDEHRNLIAESLQFMKDNSISNLPYGFNDFEIKKLERLYEYSKSQIKSIEVSHLRIDFISYFNEYDRRKKTNLLKTFPELEESIKKWTLLKENMPVFYKTLRFLIRLAHHHLPKLF